ncbi:MAG: polysaccharide deacetylase family protein [Xanthomonadales bacterium]|nr:polysaccharide deacetylase family protein [Xanthomonadales bacterium]
MRTVVLTYHSVNINGNDYGSNDHIALLHDLRVIAELGLPVVPLRQVVVALDDPASAPFERAVALSCDDGSWFDWHDLPHPTWGMQRSFRGILHDHHRDTGIAAGMSSFVIASPQARADLDRLSLIDKGWWDDSWWPQAATDSLLRIENHSWDHNHEAVSQRVAPNTVPGSFSVIDNFERADRQIHQASDYLNRHCAPWRSTLFAYPYGDSNDYLQREYLPSFQHQHGLRAAFTTEPKPITPTSDRWALGRYVCGFHWNSPDDLRNLLMPTLSATW